MGVLVVRIKPRIYTCSLLDLHPPLQVPGCELFFFFFNTNKQSLLYLVPSASGGEKGASCGTGKHSYGQAGPGERKCSISLPCSDFPLGWHPNIHKTSDAYFELYFPNFSMH